MKYPAIVKPEQHEDVRVLVFREEFDKNAIHLEGDAKGKVVDYRVGENLENVTAEYLANTYGEVKSKWHAHFIVELGESAGYELCGSVSPNDAGQFIFDAEHKRLYFTVDNVKFVGMKQITIPLPPECEEKIYRYEGMGNKPKHLDCVCNKCGGRCCIGNCDEWPKVGDTVCWSNRNHKAVVKSLCDGYAWVKELGGECLDTVHIDKLRKPKTPEEELNYELYRLCLNHCDSKFQASEIARKLMAKYNITKKGEGDE